MKRLLMLAIVTTGVTTTGSACPLCNKKIFDGIYNSQFYPNLLTMLSAFLVLAVIVAILTALTFKRHKIRLTASSDMTIRSPVPMTAVSMIIGVGLGGFIDGIILHQILQIHEMLSNKVAATNYIGKSVNMFWDGIFHFFCLIVVLIGIISMWRLYFKKNIDCSGKLLSGGLLLGWGLFNIVEGITNHHILKLHNVIEFSGDHNIGNFSFLGVSIVMLVIGCALVNVQIKHKSNTTIQAESTPL